MMQQNNSKWDFCVLPKNNKKLFPF